MPQKAIKFTGINRKVNEFNCSGECEELINLRPDILGGHQVIRPKHITHPSVPYVQIYEHTFGNTYNQIAISEDGSILWINPEDGKIITITDKFDSNDIQLSSAGNVLVAYCEDNKTQMAFKFEDETYKGYDISLPLIKSIGVSFADEIFPYHSATADDSSIAAHKDALAKAASGFYEKYPNGLCGAVVISCAYELEDGSEIWSTAYVVANVYRLKNIEGPFIGEQSMGVQGATNTTLHISLEKEAASDVKRINIYSTRPVLPYDLESQANGLGFYVKDLNLAEVNLDGQLMYYMGSVVPDRTELTFKPNFGISQAGEDVLEVNSGCIDRVGSSVSYNNRFHFYKSEVQHIIQVPTVSDDGSDKDSVSNWVAYVDFDGKENWKMIDKIYSFSEGVPNDFIYPMSGIKTIAFVKGTYESGVFKVPYTDMFYVGLSDSSAYNYSYAFDVTPSSLPVNVTFYDIISDTGQIWGNTPDKKVLWKKESNAINVSAQYNPFVFPVEYSYSFSGEILDIATSYLPISSTQVGQYPLTIFTSNGVFALEQGNGAVLYSNIVPLQPLVIDGNAAATPYGTFFISSKNLYVLSGREIANASYVLNGERETALRELDSYKALCCNKKGIFFDFTPLLSSKDFEDFISGAVLTYDQLNNELMISSTDPQTSYSYVFNLDTKAYHKIARRYLKSQNGGRYAIEVTGDTKNVVDLQKEERSDNQPVLIQSRPMPIEAFYSHIQRLILLVDAKLTNENHNLCLSVFGSDNLHDWKCIISSQKHDTILRQIRTNRSAKSYKDYVFLITGTVDTDTNISELIADYTAVTRRLG